MGFNGCEQTLRLTGDVLEALLTNSVVDCGAAADQGIDPLIGTAAPGKGVDRKVDELKPR